MDLDRIFRDIARVRPPARWNYEGTLRFITGGRQIDGLGSSFVRLRDGVVKARLDLRRRTLDDDREHEGTLEITTDRGSAVATHISAYPKWFNETVGYKIRLHDLTVGDLNADVAFARETVLGVTLGWPDSVAPAFRTRVFGRDAFITGCNARGKAKTDSVQVVYVGAPFALGSNERATLHDLLRFLGGRRGGSWFIETFDAQGQRVSFYFQHHGRIKRFDSFLQPINLRRDSTEIAVLASALPHMLDRLADFRQANPAKVAATIHHFDDAATQSFPTSRLRDLSVTLESLVGAIRGSQPRSVPWLEEGFEERLEPVLKAFDGSFAGVSDPPLGALRKKILGLNNASPREDLFRFLESYGARPWPVEEKTILRYRNGILHTGHKDDESDLNTLRRNQEAADALANVFNRAFLRILGYDGNYYESSEWKSVPLDAKPSYPLLEEM